MLFFPRHVDGDRTNHTDLRPLICVALGMKVVGWLFGFVLVGPLLFCLCFWVVGCFVYLGLICGWFFCFIVLRRLFWFTCLLLFDSFSGFFVEYFGWLVCSYDFVICLLRILVLVVW